MTKWLTRLGIGLVAFTLVGCDVDYKENLESVRIKPQHLLELPDDIQFDDGGVHYLIEPYAPLGVEDYERFGAHYLVHARVDGSDVFLWPGSKLNPGPYRNYSYFYAAVFPEMRQPTPKEMKEMGWSTPGYIRVHIMFATKTAQDKGIVYTQIEPEHNECIKEFGYIYFDSTEPHKFGLAPYCMTPPKYKIQDIFYLNFSDNGQPSELIKCSMSSPHNHCKVRAQSRMYPMLDYEIAFEAGLLERWREIIGAVRNKIDSQIQDIYMIDDSKEK